MLSELPPLVEDPRRLTALMSTGILDTPPEPGFDDIVQLACQICAVPVALVSLVSNDRQWFKARVNFPAHETDLSRSVCAHALAEPDRLLVIPDLTTDPRTKANPLVTGEPFIRFYAGAPLVTVDGHVLGTLCAIDKVPRSDGLSDAQAEGMKALARQVMTQLALRQAVLARDALRAEEAKAYAVREAFHSTQNAVGAARGDLDTVLDAVVQGAMRALPAAEGGTVELIDGPELEYRAVRGTLSDHLGLRLSLSRSLSGHCAGTGRAQRMDDAEIDPHVARDLLKRLRLRSAVVAPILRGDVVLGVLKLQSSLPNVFTDRDLQVAELFAGTATAGLAEAEAHARLVAKDVYWRGMFERLSEGFVVGEVVRDASRHITDWRYLDVNPAWSQMVGVSQDLVVGRTIREVLPGIEEEWITDVAEVVETGQPHQFTRQVGNLRRWYEGRSFKIDADRFGITFLEVTARVEAEERRNALLALGDRLRDLTSIPDMTRAAAEIVGRTLGASRAGFGRIEGDVAAIDIEPDWTAPGMASITGHHRFDDYGDIRAHLQRGEALVIDDVTIDPRTRANPARMQAIDIAALVNMPIRERGRTVAVFIVHDRQPRKWTAEELGFLRNVADRVEVGVARLQSEDQQTILNRELAHRLKNTLAIVQSIATQTLRGVTEREPVQAFDQRVLALSRAHDVLLEKSWSAAKLKAVMTSILELQADLDRFAFDGPDLDINPQAAMSLSLLLHELATNATKYGALSNADGTVRIAWRTDNHQSPTLVLDWTEEGGPHVIAPPTGRTGFGSKLIRMGLMGTRKAEVSYRPLGLHAEFRAPLVEILTGLHEGP